MEKIVDVFDWLFEQPRKGVLAENLRRTHTDDVFVNT